MQRFASARPFVSDTGRALAPLRRVLSSTTPGDADAKNFDCSHPSVDFWRQWSWDAQVGAAGGSSWRAFRHVVTETIAKSWSDDREYWGYHGVRSLAFASQGALSLSVDGLRQIIAGRGGSGGGGSSGGGGGLTSLLGVASEVARILPGNATKATATGHRLFSEALHTFRQDLEHVQAGYVRRPWDMVVKRGRQWNPLWLAQAHANYMGEALKTLDRRNRAASGGAPPSTDVWLKIDAAPDYYLNNTFHFQTDGWLSSQSAEVYETSTETLFVGRQDAMQRHALVPIAQFLQDRAKDQKVDLIELGCGTGRFHTFLRDNLPPDANTIALDLSPFYLEHAKRNDRRWRRLRAAEAVKPATFIHAAAESVPLPSKSQDIVVMVYLLHECPSDARRSLAAEAARLLRPGGLCVVADSIQLGDRPALDSSLAVFKDFNEPHYESYISEDMAAVFCELDPERKIMASSTKILSFRKPGVCI